MTPKSHPSGLDEIPRHDELVAFDPDEFVTAFTWAMNAASGKARVADPTKQRVNLVEEDGSTTPLQVAHTDLTRILIAMRERYGASDMSKYYSAAFRIMALLDILPSAELAPWRGAVPGEPGREQIANSVIEAAATVPLDEKGQFPIREFIRTVKEIDAAKERGGP